MIIEMFQAVSLHHKQKKHSMIVTYECLPRMIRSKIVRDPQKALKTPQKLLKTRRNYSSTHCGNNQALDDQP